MLQCCLLFLQSCHLLRMLLVMQQLQRPQPIMLCLDLCICYCQRLSVCCLGMLLLLFTLQGNLQQTIKNCCGFGVQCLTCLRQAYWSALDATLGNAAQPMLLKLPSHSVIAQKSDF